MRKILIIALCLGLVFVSCSKADPYEGVVIDMSESFISEAATSNSLALSEETVYLTDEHPEVKKLIAVTNDLEKALINRSYESLTGREGWEYCTDKYVEELEGENNAKHVVDYYTAKEIISEIISVEITSMNFNATGDRVTVKCKSTIRLLNATDLHKKDVEAVDGVFEADHMYKFLLTEKGWMSYKIVH